MDRNEILAKLHNQFPSLPHNALLTIYKARSECMRLLMGNYIPADICWLIEVKVRLAGELPPNLLHTCLVVVKEIMQENEELEEFLLLVISVPESIVRKNHVL